MSQLPPLRALQTFEAAGRTGSFLNAAKELSVTPSAVSHQVKLLEEYLGIALFERRTRQISLTLAGAAYLETVSSAFMQLEVATRRARRRQSAGELKLAVAPAFLDRWLLPRLQNFTDRYPDIEMDIHSSVGEIDFKNSDIDMAVYFGDGQWSDVNSVELRPSFLVPVCAPILLEQERILEPADLLVLRLLQVKKRPDEWPAWFARAGVDYHPSQGSISFSNGMTAASAAARGLGVALTDPSLVSEEIERGELMIPIDIALQLPKSFYLVTQRGRSLNPAMQMFHDWINGRMQEDLQRNGLTETIDI